MTYWLTGDEEHDDPRFTTGTLGLYVRAGSWCMAQVRYRPEIEVPLEWLVPDWLGKGWGANRLANELVASGIWEPLIGGWRYGWIRHQNTAHALREQRKREREKWARKQTKRTHNTPGELGPTPQGSYRGELPP